MTNTTNQSLLVTGASGQMGQHVLDLLLEAGETSIIATTRNPEKLADYVAKGVDVRQADFDKPYTLASAFAGADRVLLISTDAVGEPGKRVAQHINAINAAESAGVQHVVYTSLVEADNSPVLFAPDHEQTEQALADSTMGWTVLRMNLYMDLTIQSIKQAYQMGNIFGAKGQGKTAYITREDCARAAAAALRSDFDGKRTLDVTGAEALTQAEVAKVAAEVTGKPLGYVPVELDKVIEGMVGAGLPRPVAETYASIDTATEEGKFATVSSAFEELTDSQPTLLKDFLLAHKDTLSE